MACASSRVVRPREKLGIYRDPSALALAQALVLSQAEQRDRRKGGRLLAQLDQLIARVHLKSVPEAEALLTAARESPVDRGEQPVALGDVSVAVVPPPPPAPKIEIELPEPYSLLAIPAPDGSLRAWFDHGGPP